MPIRIEQELVDKGDAIESEAAMVPGAPSEPVPHSSGFVVKSEHAVISGWCACLFSTVQSIPRAVCVETRVDCAVSHGLGKSGGKGTIQTFPAHLAWSEPFVGTQSAQVGRPGVESVSRATYISTPSKPLFSSSGIEVTREHAGISGFFC